MIADREKLLEIRGLARTIMDQHGLDNWRFGWLRHPDTVGYRLHERKTLYVNQECARRCSVEVIREAILHEVAHALVGENHHHDEAWRAKALELGASGERWFQQAPEELGLPADFGG